MPIKKSKSIKKKIHKKIESKPKSIQTKAKKVKAIQIDPKQKLEFDNLIIEYKDLIKALEYKRYKTSQELSSIISILTTFFNSNEFFRDYCKKVRISSYLLSKDIEVG